MNWSDGTTLTTTVVSFTLLQSAEWISDLEDFLMKTRSFLMVLTFCFLSTISLTESGALVAGDVNASGEVNALDVQLVINAALGLTVQYDCDIDISSEVNAVDVQLVINAALGLSIDADSDGLSDAAESNLNTDPDDFDTDDDGVGDGQEVLDGTDPGVMVNDPPQVELIVDLPTGTAPHQVLLEAVATDPEGSPLSYDWDFGDGTSDSEETRVLHAYETEDTYTVTVTVSDGDLSGEASADVTVGPLPQESAEIGTEGGTVEIGGCTLTVDPGLAPQSVPFSLTELPSMAPTAARDLDESQFVPIGQAYRLETPLKSSLPMTVTISYNPADIPNGFAEDNLGMMIRLIGVPQPDPDSDTAPDIAPIVSYIPLPASPDPGTDTVSFEVVHRGTFQLVAMAEPLDVEDVVVPSSKAKSSATFKIEWQVAPTLGKTAYKAALYDSMSRSFTMYDGQKGLPIVPGTVKVIVGNIGTNLGQVYTGDPWTVYLSYSLKNADTVKTTFAHEYFHTIHFYNSNTASTSQHFKPDAWFIEGTPDWGGDETYDNVVESYYGPKPNRFSIPLNFDRYDGDTEYRTVAFWKWVESKQPGTIASMIWDHRGRTNVPLGNMLIETSTAVSWQEVFLAQFPAVEFLDFASAALYFKDFDTDETKTKDLWHADYLGPANQLPASLDDKITFSQGAPGDGKDNPKTVRFSLKQHLTVAAHSFRSETEGPHGFLHVKFPLTLSDKPLDAIVISSKDGETVAAQKAEDFSQKEHEVTVPFYRDHRAVVMVVDPQWKQDPNDTPINVDVEVWVEDPCGALPANVTDVSTTAELVAAVHAGSSTIRLAAGTYTPAVQTWPRCWDNYASLGLSDQTLVGAGPGQTIIDMSGAGACIWAQGRVTLRNLTVIERSPYLAILAGNIDDLICCNMNLEVKAQCDGLSFEPWYPGSNSLYLFNCNWTGPGQASNYSGVLTLTPNTDNYMNVVVQNTTMSGWDIALSYATGGTLGPVSADIDCSGFSNNRVNVSVGSCYFQDGANYCDYTEQCPSGNP